MPADPSSSNPALRVLILEDNPDDALLLQHELNRAGYAPHISVVDTRVEFLDRLNPDVDLILSDHALPQFNAMEALTLLKQRGLDIPFIIVSGVISEETAVEAMRYGAADYLLKDRLARLGEAVRNALREREHRREKERAFVAIRRSEALNRSILASLSAHIAVVDRNGRIVSVNDAWQRFAVQHGNPTLRSADVCTNYLEVCRKAAGAGDASAQEAAAGIEDVLEGRRPQFVMEYACAGPVQTYWFEMRVTPLAGDDYGGAVVAHTDITDRKRYENQLIEAKEAAEEMARLKSTILTNMSHEIRTPLTSILGFAELLAGTTSEEDREFARLIHVSGTRLLETLNSVLDLAQIEGGTMRLHLQPVELGAAVHRALDVIRPQLMEAGLSVAENTPAPVYALVDPGALDRVLANLLSNALKFTREGGITVTAESRGARALIHVADTGVGIDPEFLPHIFEEFKQESRGLGRDFEGTGIGLTIVRRLVELMGGEISVESEKGRGSTFTVSLRRTGTPR